MAPKDKLETRFRCGGVVSLFVSSIVRGKSRCLARKGRGCQDLQLL